MKHLAISVVALASVFASPVFAADVGVSVSVGQPGFYGRIDIGDYPYPHPQVIYSRPRIIERVYIEQEPIYLHVPPGHAKNWSKHCHKYNACGERVYFVKDSWYNQEYVPRYQERHHEAQDHRRDEMRNDGGEGRGGDAHNNKGSQKSGKNRGNERNH